MIRQALALALGLILAFAVIAGGKALWDYYTDPCRTNPTASCYAKKLGFQ